MKVGVPKEIKAEENRVALTPAGVSALVGHGHTVLVEKGAGVGSGLLDDEYMAMGARILPTKEDVWDQAEMIIKVKEPLGPEFGLIKDHILFTYFHLSADLELTKKLLATDVKAVAYETIQLADGSLPLLAPMSEVAGRLSIQMGARCLESIGGGKGILLSGVSGVPPAKVVILGAGIAGSNACFVAVGMGARVSILDINPAKLRYIHDVMGGHVVTIMSNGANIDEEVMSADLVVGTILIPGAKAPKLVTRDMIKRMKKGSAIVDISVDQGGCTETTKPTTHSQPTYIVDDVVHYAVANMPGAVPRTSTFALTNSTLSYALALADKGLDGAINDDPALKKGVNILNKRLTYQAVAEAFNMEYSEL
ncbi:MAG: alanine dehydrogenase [Deltaproteobacteria bacterium]|nr:alanine dehydrogenase [Candidatus Zymogenaceae bacterium]